MAVTVPVELLPSRKFRRIAISAALLATALVLMIFYVGAKPWEAIGGFDKVLRLASEIFPPNFKVLWQKKKLAESLLETLSMAFLGTLGGGLIAFTLAFFAAVNTSPHPALRFVVRGLLAMERSIPNFVVLLVLLVAVGVGPFAGMLSLMVGSVGMFGKLFADSIEQSDAGIVESLQSVGSTRLQLIRYGILPQVAPSFVANWFYAFDVNLRSAIALGVFGGGGIGFQLHVADRVLRFHDVLAYSLLIVVLITGMEKISDFARRRILSQPLAH